MVNETVKLASEAARALPSNFEPVRKALGLSVEQALRCFDGAQGAHARTVVEDMNPFGVNGDGQLQMHAQHAWDLIAYVLPPELIFRFLAALDTTSLVALIREMQAWRFHDHASRHWMGPATNDRLAAMMAFDAAYTRLFTDRLANARQATGSELGPILDELGLLLAAAPIWTVGDLFKLLDKESRLPEFQTDTAFVKGWNAAHENVTLAEKKFSDDAEKKECVLAFLEEMNLSDERDRALIFESPPLLNAIYEAQDSEVFDGHAVMYGDKLGLFRELVNTAPALAWRYLSSTSARQDLMGRHRAYVQPLLERIADLSADGVSAEVDVLVRSVVNRVAEFDGPGKDADVPAKILANWMEVLPPPARSLLKQALGEAFKPASIDRWLQRSEHLNGVWQATATPDANASLVG